MKEQILIIEDERIIAYDIKRHLENSGYFVPAIFAYGEEAIEQVKILKPDLILMDIMLKGNINGIETAKQIREKYPIPIVYLTAFCDDKNLQEAKLTKPFGYILKPFDETQLITTIEIALNLHQTENLMEEALIKEQERHKAKSNFISMVSHEFRNPLTTILTSTEILRYHSDKIDDFKKSQYLNHIQNSVQQMNQLLGDLLLVGKSELNKVKFQPKPLKIEKFCQELVSEVEYFTNSKNTIKLVIQGRCLCDQQYNSSKENLPLWDEKLLHHILTNLLTNAIKYSPKGKTVKFDLFCLQEEVIFRIQDEGIGIPYLDQEHLFNSFYRASNVRDIPGNGLGLVIVKEYVELHGGEITFVSKEGVGSTFIVSIPYVQVFPR